MDDNNKPQMTEEEALAKLEANKAEIQRIIDDSKARQAEQSRAFDEFENKIQQTAQAMKTAFDELDKDETEAMDELDALNLQFAEDMAKLDEEDEAEEKAEEEEKED
ncbi:MAG TPA: hypothetical protein VFK07_01705 [Candidatus Paceibacterota bacterium]|nr:hypothetical protein [Candidatus Paceibacterota bacterium]